MRPSFLFVALFVLLTPQLSIAKRTIRVSPFENRFLARWTGTGLPAGSPIGVILSMRMMLINVGNQPQTGTFTWLPSTGVSSNVAAVRRVACGGTSSNGTASGVPSPISWSAAVGTKTEVRVQAYATSTLATAGDIINLIFSPVVEIVVNESAGLMIASAAMQTDAPCNNCTTLCDGTDISFNGAPTNLPDHRTLANAEILSGKPF